MPRSPHKIVCAATSRTVRANVLKINCSLHLLCRKYLKITSQLRSTKLYSPANFAHDLFSSRHSRCCRLTKFFKRLSQTNRACTQPILGCWSLSFFGKFGIPFGNGLQWQRAAMEEKLPQRPFSKVQFRFSAIYL